MSVGCFQASVVPLFAAVVRWAFTYSIWSDRVKDSDEISVSLVNTLHRQLERCGPEALRAAPCPNCETGFSEYTVWRAGLFGFVIGLLVSFAVVGSWIILTARPPRADVTIWSTGLELTDADTSSQPRWSPGSGRTSRIVRRGG